MSGVPTLPRTGGAATAELAALAALFIAAGSFGMRVSRPRAAAQLGAVAPAASAQSAQAFGSSVSNLPDTG